MRNYTRIPAPRVTLVNTQTGIVADEWFRFFNNLYTIAYAATGSVTAGTYGSATAVPQITVDDFGTITGISNVPIAIDASQIVSGTIASARISGAYTGITGVGTLTVGTWNATAITTAYGGTGLTSYTAGDTLYYASGTALSNLAIGASTYINTSSGTAPQWTDPATITVGKATNIAGGAANRIAYQTAADTTGFIVAPTVSDTYLNWSGTAFQWSSNPLGTVTSVSVVSANGLAGTVATATTTPAITLSTTITGLLKGNGTAISAASSGTDYAPATSGTSILYGNGAGGFSNVTIGTGVSFVGGTLSATGSGGTVTSVAALTLGTTGTDLSSTVANSTTTPVITLNVPTASAANRGALSAADWTTFNSKAPGVTFTTGYIPFGQGTTTLNQDAALFWDNTNKRLGLGVSSGLQSVLDVRTLSGAAVITVRGGTPSSIQGDGLISLQAQNATGAGVSFGTVGVTQGAAGNTTAADMYFTTRNSAGTNAERMRIFSTGGVSIGNTTDPGATNLSVTGTGAFGSTITATASAAASVEGVFTNTNTGASASAGVRGIGNSTGYYLLRQYGTGVTATVFGITLANYALLASDGASSNGLMVGSLTSDPVIFGSNNVERARIDSAGNTYIETGTLWQYAPAPTSKAAAATLTAAEVQTGILNTTGTTYTVTLPTGTALDTAFAGVPATNIGFDWFVVNSASGIITIAVGATGMTSLGTLTIATGVSAQFRLRRTAANTYVLYRLG